MVLGFGLTMPHEETKCQGIRTNPNNKVIYIPSLSEGGAYLHLVIFPTRALPTWTD